MTLWRFNRKVTGDEVNSKSPKQVKDYYEPTQPQQMGVAWLLAFGTLVLTVILAFGIFFGGRWIYRELTNSNSKTASISGETKTTSTTATQSDTGESKTSKNTAESNTGTSSTATNSPSTKNVKTPNTGPGNMVAVFVLTSVASTGFYYVFAYQRKAR